MSRYLAAFDAMQGGPADPAVLNEWQASSDPRAWLFAAAALAASGRPAEARRELARIAEHAKVAGALLVAAGALHFELGDFQAALACLDRVAAEYPDDAYGAVLLKFRLAMSLGWRRDVIAAGERLLALDPARAREVHAELQRLLASEDNCPAALRHWGERVSLEPESSARQWEGAHLFSRLGRFGDVRTCVARALQLGDSTAAAQLEAARVLEGAGAFADAERHALAVARGQPECAEAELLHGELRLWQGDADAVLAAAARVLANDPDCAAAHRLRGGALVLRQRYADALAALDCAIAGDAADAAAHSFRAEALLRLGRLPEARAALERHPSREDTCYWIRSLLLALVALRQRSGIAGWLRALVREFPNLSLQPRLLVDANYELRRALCALVPDGEALLSRPGARRRRAVLEAALTALRGNRSDRPTAYDVADGALRYVPRACPRQASVAVLGLIKTAPPESVVQAFAAVIAEYPDSSLPVCYRGEVHLWLGNYADARADLEAAIAQRATTRWAYYGLASLANVEGDPRGALAVCARSVRVLRSEAPPIYVHRGEAFRRLGRRDDALRELRLACELGPTRLSARLNLALAEGAAGDGAGETAGYRWLCAHAPGLVSDAGFDLGIGEWRTDAGPSRDERRALLEHMLIMMRGNRASSFATWIGRSGMVRIASAALAGPTALNRLNAEESNRHRALRELLRAAAVGGNPAAVAP
jgi:tetratricopeptide (TPR) repeat protein